jgi:hypothetical protein
LVEQLNTDKQVDFSFFAFVNSIFSTTLGVKKASLL